MKINYLKINGFGKLEDKEIKMSENINLIYGNNEAGKSTLLKFIAGMFYGISKNKNKKEFSDYERYKPWNKDEFSGKIIYQLDNNEQYEVFRDFTKKNPIIYNKNGEDISKHFNIDKTKGNEFFYEQTQIDEETFFSTAMISQKQVVLDNNEQQTLTQKMANILSTGEENISYKKAMEKLNKKQLEEIGTERTNERPINIINSKIEEIKEEIKEIKLEKERKNEVAENIKNIEKEILEKNTKIELIKEIKKYKEEERIEEEKIKINKKIIEEENEKINNLKNKINNEQKNKNKKNYLLFIMFLLIIINILLLIFNKNKIFLWTLIAFSIISIFLIIFNYRKKIKNKNLQKDYKNKIKNEIEIIENNIKNIENKIKNTEREINKNTETEKILIKNKYNKNIEEIDNLLNLNSEKINIELEETENVLSASRLKLNTNEIDYKNLEEKENKYVELEEKLQGYLQEKEDLKSLNNSIELTKQALENAYKKMKNEITPKFTKNLSEIVEKISAGKYKNVKFMDGEGIIVELENGEYVNANKLSIGTIDQLYLSLRLSAIQEISEENMPIILDEAFAYYDTERLTNILTYLNKTYTNKQIIIFTCSKREQEILEKNNIKYTITNLQ